MGRYIFAQLFFDTGSGFNEDDSQRIPIGFGHVSIVFNISSIKNLLKLRFDPTNVPCVLTDLKITYKNADSEKTMEFYITSDGAFSDNSYVFFHDDPNMNLSWNADMHCQEILIEFYLADAVDLLTDYRNIVNRQLDSTLESQIQELKKLNKSINAKLSTFEGEMNFQQSQISQISKNVKIIPEFEVLNSKLNNILPSDEIIRELRKLEEIKSKLKLTEEKLKHKNIQLDDLQALNLSLNDKIDRLESQITVLPSKKNQKQLDIELEQNKKQLEKIKIDLGVCKKENNSIKRSLRSLEKKKEKFIIEKTKFEASLEAKKDELERTTNRLNAEIKMLLEEKKSMNVKTEELSKTKKEYKKLLQEITALGRHI